MLRVLKAEEISIVAGGLDDFDEFGNGDDFGGGGGGGGGFDDGFGGGGGYDVSDSGDPVGVGDRTSQDVPPDPSEDIIVMGQKPHLTDEGGGIYVRFYPDHVDTFYQLTDNGLVRLGNGRITGGTTIGSTSTTSINGTFSQTPSIGGSYSQTSRNGGLNFSITNEP